MNPGRPVHQQEYRTPAPANPPTDLAGHTQSRPARQTSRLRGVVASRHHRSWTVLGFHSPSSAPDQGSRDFSTPAGAGVVTFLTAKACGFHRNW